DTTGSRILMYCLPRKVLHITGKDVLTTPIPEDQIASVIEAGRPPEAGNRVFASKYDNEPVPELLKLLGSWSPVVRHFAALSLSKKGGDHTDELLALLNGRDRNARYGACTALRKTGSRSAPAVGALIGLLHSDDQLLQTHAIMALGATGDRRAVKPLLELAAGEFPNDRKGIMHRIVARALFIKTTHGGQDGLLANSIDGVDRELLYPAVRRLLRCKGGHERSMTADAVLKKLTLAELEPLWPSMVRAMRECAPTGVMFASGIRMAVAEILAENKIEEGMELLLEYARIQKMHGSGERNRLIAALLKQYGAPARELIPAMEEYITFLEKEHPHTDKGRPGPQSFYRGQIPWIRDAMDSIKASDRTPELISIGAYLDRK
ncbi:MAG: HEAT repeat domain-containing protein, partial [Planctomycetota bacterium]